MNALCNWVNLLRLRPVQFVCHEQTFITPTSCWRNGSDSPHRSCGRGTRLQCARTDVNERGLVDEIEVAVYERW